MISLINYPRIIGIFRGKSTFVLGRGKGDVAGGTLVSVSAGDVLVLPAGTAHASVKSTDDYKYIGVYPVVCSSYTRSWQPQRRNAYTNH